MAVLRSYNPLSVDELGRNAARALMRHPPSDLPPSDGFDGAGVYTIHYAGPFPAYSGMAKDEPIYVGKADPSGKRQGRAAAQRAEPVLHQRLSKHARSIESVENLALPDFRCRWLVLDPVWIGLTEQVLIAEYRPLWNVVVAGFGINAPGKGRSNQKRSQWDTLHPGRPEVAGLPDRDESAAAIPDAIAEHRATGKQEWSGVRPFSLDDF